MCHEKRRLLGGQSKLVIYLKNVAKAFGEKWILKPTTYCFPKGERIALVGANGQGKTTLLNLITGIEALDEGDIIKPKAIRLSVLPQSPHADPKSTLIQECMSGHTQLVEWQSQLEDLSRRMASQYCEADFDRYEQLLKSFEEQGGYRWEGLAEKILLGLGFKVPQLTDHPTSLSGGWRMRLELAKVLIAKPDFMILDEPTNHLDLPSIEWLESWLLTYTGTLLFVSHDRMFLNQLATHVLHLTQGQLHPYTGNFDRFLEQKQQGEQTAQATRKNLAAQQVHIRRFVDRFRSKASKASQVGSRLKMITRLETLMDDIPEAERQATLRFPHLPFPRSGQAVLNVKQLQVGYQHPLIQPFDLSLQRGQRLAIIGANGLGKSTLLKTLAGKIPPLQGQIHYGNQVELGLYTQDAAEKLDKQLSIFNTLTAISTPLDDPKRLMLLSAFLFRNHELQKSVSVLSGGERSRLALCCLLAQLPNCLMLDEPTNHLDLNSTEMLAKWLQQFPGTVVFVSHHRDFLDQVATTILEIDAKGFAHVHH